MLMELLIWWGITSSRVFLIRYDHETEEDYQKMSIVEKRILSNYKQFTEDYDPLAEGLFESWNWNSDLDL